MAEKRWLTKEERKLLTPFGEHYSAMYDHIAEFSDDELAKLTAACRACATDNCWWALYEAAQYLLNEIRTEMQVRVRRAATEAQPHIQLDNSRLADDGGLTTQRDEP
jgi:hypothetical protein